MSLPFFDYSLSKTLPFFSPSRLCAFVDPTSRKPRFPFPPFVLFPVCLDPRSDSRFCFFRAAPPPKSVTKRDEPIPPYSKNCFCLRALGVLALFELPSFFGPVSNTPPVAPGNFPPPGVQTLRFHSLSPGVAPHPPVFFLFFPGPFYINRQRIA